MGRFLWRRLLHSCWVLLGVLLLTFLLFQLAAGDPAAAVLGKNPAPQELESLRRELGSDLPNFYGHWRTSETFASQLLDGVERALPGIRLPAKTQFTGTGVAVTGKGSEVVLLRQFEIPEAIRIIVKGAGNWQGPDGMVCDLTQTSGCWELQTVPEKAVFTLQSEQGRIDGIQVYRYQADGWNSQFGNALHELVAFKKEFPFVSFLNFGRTLITREPINRIIAEGIGPSLSVMLPIFLGELLLGIVLAMIAAACKDSWFDRLLLVISVLAMSVSYLVLIIAGQWYLGYYLGLFPVWGWNGIYSLLLPVLIGILSSLGEGVRFYRTIFVNELEKEYLRSAAAKGCSWYAVYFKHLLRNAVVPIIARASAVLPFIFTGSLLLESFFGIPGLGYASVDALNNSDLALLKALTIVNALLFIVINLLADLLCAWFDPRIRLDDRQ